MIPSSVVRRAEYIIDESQIVPRVAAAMRTSTRGRPTNTAVMRTMLVGMFLTIHTRGSATFTAAAEVLRSDLEFDDQLRLGVRHLDGTTFDTMTRDHFYYLTKKIGERLGYGPSMDLEDADRAARHHAVQEISDGLMDVFDLDWPSTMYALDATGIWSWHLARSDRPKHGVEDAFADDDTAAPPAMADQTLVDTGEQDAESDEAADDGTEIVFVSSGSDPDAAWGYKTPKRGSQEIFFGFHEHTLVQVPAVGQTVDDQPPIIRRFELTPANQSARQVSFDLLDRCPSRVEDLLVDRLYSNFRFETWKTELDARDIAQHIDLMPHDQKFLEVDRLRWVAGCAHCPSTPDSLADIPRPGPSEPEEKFRQFHRRIDLRAHYKLAVHTPLNAAGKERLRCPALAGTVGCPLRAGSIEAALDKGLPIIEKPPNPKGKEPLPACCTQATVQVTPPPQVLKHRQEHIWGSKEWNEVYGRRTYVEGSYGNRKNPSTENLRRGHFRVNGLAWIHLIMGLVNASYNLRMIRNWQERTGRGDPSHPLLTPDDEPFAYIAITESEARTLARKRSARAA